MQLHFAVLTKGLIYWYPEASAEGQELLLILPTIRFHSATIPLNELQPWKVSVQLLATPSSCVVTKHLSSGLLLSTV